VKQEQNPVILQVVRYGLPLVVAVFYCTAALSFHYTPDSTYVPLQWVRSGEGVILPLHAGEGQNPLWMLLLKAGGVVRLDLLLTAKVFSLVFCCFSLLALYLVAVAVTRDRLLALCCALVAALDPLLLQAGPSGGGLGLGLSLSLTAMFFLLRGEDLPAALFAGLCSLVFWQAFLLFALILVDIGINRPAPGKSRWLIGAVSIVYGVVVAPWVLVALAYGRSPAPELVPFAEFPAVTWLRVLLLLLCAGLVVAGFIFNRKSGKAEESPVRSGAILWSWVLWMAICGVVWGQDFWFLGALLIVVGAFDGLRRVVTVRSAIEPAYAFAFLLTGVFLFINQFTFISSVKPVMARVADEAQDLEYVAFWAKAHVPPAAKIQSEKTGLVGYITERSVDTLPDGAGPVAEFVVSTRSYLPGYVEVYRPQLSALDSLADGARVAFFQRQ
jgi:hypothetical protein